MARLGGTAVSRLCLGCMSFGTKRATGIGRHSWTVGGQEAQDAIVEMVATARAMDVNFFDTANVYSSGDSEVVTGRALREVFERRSQYVVATKLGLPMYDEPNAKGTSRKHVREAIEESLKRLEMDYVDLLIVHRLDGTTCPEETMEALHEVVKRGQALYIGASSMYAWEFARLQAAAERRGLTKFVSMQNHYNLLYREEEREMVPMCADMGVLMTPWSPLARGLLARSAEDAELTERAQSDPVFNSSLSQADRAILDAVGQVAAELGVSRAAVGIAWLLHKGCAPVVGATSNQQLAETLGAANIVLSDEHVALLEAPYIPKPHGVGVGRTTWSKP